MESKMSIKEEELVVLKKGIEEEGGVHDQMHALSDSIYEILTRVSIDTLFRRCRWVCKDWEKLIYNTKFKLAHLEKTRTISGYFIQSLERGKYRSSFVSMVDHHSSSQVPSPSLDFLPPTNVKIAASTPYGLLCCVGNSTTRIPVYYICKPTTWEWIQIPNPRTRYETVTMGMMVKQSYPNLHYKVIRFSNPKSGRPGYHCEIFDSNDEAWKTMEHIKLPFHVILDDHSGILVNNGSFHLLTNDDRIFVFNVDEENWTTMELPQELVDMEKDFLVPKRLVDCEGKLAVLCTNDNWKMELWVLEERSGNHIIWKKKYSIDLGSLSHETEYVSLLDMYSTDTTLMTFYDKIALYNWSNQRYITSKLLPRISSVGQVFAFQSDSAPCVLSGWY